MPRADHRDYSGTPLWKKLGIAEGSRVRVLDAPDALDRELTASRSSRAPAAIST
jgi:hypothetical protein